jgi:adenine-specific DNA-methyltransferase
MEKLDMRTPDGVVTNIDSIAALFPNCLTEDQDENGKVKRAIDFDLLRQELSDDVVDGVRERYTLSWPGKNKAIATANAPINKTLRPCPEESVDFDTTENLYIEGDNLDALKLLQETYLGKVKMIYIDPPYNTGNDFIYADNFTVAKDEYDLESGQKDTEGGRLVANPDSNGRYHSDWLSMIFPRIKLARNLLRDDGVIFISIDDSEVHNLRKMCNEIFGEDNFIANIVWQKRTSPDARFNLGSAHDYIIVYARSLEVAKQTLGKLPLSDERKASYKNPDNDPRGDWASVDMTGQTGHATQSQFYTVTTPSGMKYPPPGGRCWALAEATFKRLVEEKRIWFGVNGDARPRMKKYLSESGGINAWTWWPNIEVGHNQEATKEVKDILKAGAVFDNPKPTRLIERTLRIGMSSDDIVLDFFSGSATTAHAVMQLNAEDGGKRKFIMVQLPEACNEKSEAHKAGYKTIAEIGKERIRRAGKKIKEENATTAADLDIGFRVLKIDSSNMKDVYYAPDQLKQDELLLFKDHIKEDRNSEDLLFQVMLDWGVPLSAKIETQTVDGKNVYLVNENDLLACFDQGIDEALVKKLTSHKPLRAIFRDDSFASDSLKINVEQIFKVLSPCTEVKSI